MQLMGAELRRGYNLHLRLWQQRGEAQRPSSATWCLSTEFPLGIRLDFGHCPWELGYPVGEGSGQFQG